MCSTLRPLPGRNAGPACHTIKEHAALILNQSFSFGLPGVLLASIKQGNKTIIIAAHVAKPEPMNSENHTAKSRTTDLLTAIGRALGRTRFVVLIAVAAVMLIALSLFILGTVEAVNSIWHAWARMFNGKMHAADLTVEFLEIVTVMMKAVVFYLIGVGLFSLFITPLNVTVALGVRTLSDLEEKIVNVIVVILSVTFLQHFIQWQNPEETLYYGAALAVVVVALMLFQHFRQRAKELQKTESPNVQAKAQKEMFEEAVEEHHVSEEELNTDEDDKKEKD